MNMELLLLLNPLAIANASLFIKFQLMGRPLYNHSKFVDILGSKAIGPCIWSTTSLNLLNVYLQHIVLRYAQTDHSSSLMLNLITNMWNVFGPIASLSTGPWQTEPDMFTWHLSWYMRSARDGRAQPRVDWGLAARFRVLSWNFLLCNVTFPKILQSTMTN